MITIQTYSPQTKATANNGPYDNDNFEAMLERFLSNKIRQYLRVRNRARSVDGDVLFSYGVLPPRDQRNGAFIPAGVVVIKDGMPETIRIPQFVGTLASLADPVTYKRYVRLERDHDNAEA